MGGRGGSPLANAKRMRRNPTDAERRLWSILRGKRLAGYKRQQPLGPYIVDFVNFQYRLIVEADGSQHAENPADQKHDAWLTARGFSVRRFWNNDILTNTEQVAQAIWHALQPTLPNSSPARGEGLNDGASLV